MTREASSDPDLLHSNQTPFHWAIETSKFEPSYGLYSFCPSGFFLYSTCAFNLKIEIVHYVQSVQHMTSAPFLSVGPSHRELSVHCT